MKPLSFLGTPRRRMVVALGLGVVIAIEAVVVLTFWPDSAQAAAPSLKNASPANGFDLTNATIPVAEIFGGGPPRDGIPTIDKPKFVAADAADFLKPEDVVIGLVRGDEVRAYPLRVLVWHEIVNDRLGDEAVAVTYCPLCGTAMVFDRTFGSDVRSFGVSGLLYQSDVMLYDRETESLWSQLAMEAVAGPAVGTALKWLPSEQTTWQAWRERYPASRVLSTDTGFRRDYTHLPYQGYEQNPATMFPVPRTRDELPTKAWVAGVVVNGAAKAYALAGELPGDKWIADRVGGVAIEVRHRPAAKQFEARTTQGEALPVVQVYWFAWQAFYPQTELRK